MQAWEANLQTEHLVRNFNWRLMSCCSTSDRSLVSPYADVSAQQMSQHSRSNRRRINVACETALVGYRCFKPLRLWGPRQATRPEAKVENPGLDAGSVLIHIWLSRLIMTQTFTSTQKRAGQSGAISSGPYLVELYGPTIAAQLYP